MCSSDLDTVAPVQGGKLGIVLGDKPKGDITVGNAGINGGKIVTLPGVTPKTEGSSDKIVTLPAPGGNNGNTGINGGKIVTLPVTTVGKAGSNPDVKTGSGTDEKRIVDVPVKPKFEVRDRRETVTPKLNVTPQQTGRGNLMPGKVSSVGGNSGTHFAQSGNQNQGRRGFMH